MSPRGRHILRAVAERFGVTEADIRGPARTPSITAARSLVALLLEQLDRMPRVAIARELGRRHHSTITHAVMQARRRLRHDATQQWVVRSIRRELLAAQPEIPSMNIVTTTRLQLIETRHVRRTDAGRFDCLCVNAWERDDLIPTLLVASALLVELDGRWLLSHLMVEDDCRRRGFATELVRFYEERLGELPAGWVSDAGAAFARSYIMRFGPRPHWQIGASPAAEQAWEQLLRPAHPAIQRAVQSV